MNHELLLIQEVAEYCRVPVSTVRAWIAAGRLRSLRPGRRRLVKRSELERFLAAGDLDASRQQGAGS